MNRDHRAFLDYHAKPTSQALVELLRVHQDRIYNLCFQVLRHPQDAEDAAQEVLIEILGGVGSIRNPGAFHVWLYRVCLHTALNHKERRATRLAVAVRRSEMNSPGSSESKDEVRNGILKALAQLDDRSRALVIEHYFEERTLEELGRREGVSAVAVWKRIEKAKDRLRRTLIGTGCAVLASGIAEALESVPPVAAPAGLLGQSILSKAALVAAGGITVGAKTTLSATSMVLAFLLLGLGLVGGLLIGRHPAGADSSKVRDLEVNVAKLSADLAAARRQDQRVSAASNSESTTPNDVPSSDAIVLSPAELLKSRLARFKTWRLKANEERKANLKQIPGFSGEHWASNDARERWRAGNREELADLRELILSAPQPFIDFVKDPATAECMPDLLEFTLSKLANPGGFAYFVQKHPDFPGVLMDGLHETLLSGGSNVQSELLRFFQSVSDQPVEYLDRYRSLMSSAEPKVQALAAMILCTDRRVGVSDFQAVQAMALSPHYKEFGGQLIEALTMSSSPVAEDWFLKQLEAAENDEVAGKMINSMGRRAMFGLSRPESIEPMVSAMMRLMERPQGAMNEWAILKATAYLPADRIPGVLDRFSVMATDENAKKAGQRLAELVRDGERKPLTLFSVVQTAEELSWRRR